MLKKVKDKVKKKPKEQHQAEIKQKTAQEWLPVRDIQDLLLYRRDKQIVVVLEVTPVNISLLSTNEKKRIIAALHEVLNGLQEPVQWLSIGRSVDLDGYIIGLEQKAAETPDFVRKRLLKGYIRQAAEMASGGDTLERKFYILLSQKAGKHSEEELLNRAREMAGNLGATGLNAELCSSQKIIELLFTFFQPAQAAFERAPDHAGPYMPPVLKGVGVNA